VSPRRMCWTACQVRAEREFLFMSKHNLHACQALLASSCLTCCCCCPTCCATRSTHVFLSLRCCCNTADARKLERLLPMLVALRGRVDSPDPKQCELSERKCVIHEVRAATELVLQAVLQAPAAA
jgi:hypothetical protein